MNEEYIPLRNYETPIEADTHTERELPADAMPVNRYPLLTEPENHHYLELLQEFQQHLEHYHTVLSSPEYLMEHTKDEEAETWRRGFDIVQSDAGPQVIPLTKEHEDRPKGGVARIRSESEVSNRYFPSATFFVEVENGQEEGSALTDPYNNQPLTSFYIMVHRRNYSPRNNPTQVRDEISFVCETYDTHAHRFRDYSANYVLKGNRLSVKKHARTKFLSADHSKALLSLMDSLMPQGTASVAEDGETRVQQGETPPNEQ